nr:hypothetical protein [Tanacetum cinerariifolium]
MALPDKHQLKFNSHKVAKKLIEAIEKWFGGNTETKKVLKTLLKQQYENFIGSSSESLDQIHDRLQKLVSQLEIHGVSLSQEDVTLKKCRSPKDSRRNVAAEPQRRNVQIESSTSNALVSQCDGVGSYDWSFQVAEEPANYALMAFSSSGSSFDNEKMAQPTARNHAHSGNHEHYALMTYQYSQNHMVPVAVLTQSKPVPITVVRPVSADVPKIKVTRPKQVKPIVTKFNSPNRRHITRISSLKTSNSPPRVTAVKAPVVSAAQGLQGKWEWRPKCPILDNVSRNTSASMTLKRFDYNDALRRSKSVLDWVPKRI